MNLSISPVNAYAKRPVSFGMARFSDKKRAEIAAAYGEEYPYYLNSKDSNNKIKPEYLENRLIGNPLADDFRELICDRKNPNGVDEVCQIMLQGGVEGDPAKRKLFINNLLRKSTLKVLKSKKLLKDDKDKIAKAFRAIYYKNWGNDFVLEPPTRSLKNLSVPCMDPKESMTADGVLYNAEA